ncbi:hypothetical protein ACIBRY_24475 [Streptomyces anulatus]
MKRPALVREALAPVLLKAGFGSWMALVDDFGLTTAAATLTRRTYWRAFHPTRGSRACPRGRGKWSACGHRWGAVRPGRP